MIVKTAIAIRHVAFEDLGTLEPALRDRGDCVAYLEAGMDDLSAMDPLGPDLLVVLGGPIGAYDERDYPFISDELRMLEKRLKADRPTLGICLGAQLMARALGARVFPGTEKEIGWGPVTLTDAGKRSSLGLLATPNSAESQTLPVLHWHGDTFDVPQGAALLASTKAYSNQAFQWQQRGLALQFHVEITGENFERWLIGHACEIGTTPGLGVPLLRQGKERFAGPLAAANPGVWKRWLTDVGL